MKIRTKVKLLFSFKTVLLSKILRFPQADIVFIKHIKFSVFLIRAF